MILLSRIFKASSYLNSDETFLLSVKNHLLHHKTEEQNERLQENERFLKDAEQEAQTIIHDAEEMAKRILADATQQAAQMREAAEAELQEWTTAKHKEAEAQLAEERQQALQEGYQTGVLQGKEQALAEEHQSIEAARQLLESAYAEKRKIIAEAEPFLVELSTQIAKKVIGEELALSEEKKLDLLGRYLQRSRVHGEITLCVNQRDYPFMQEHRQQLASLLDGQAELMIFPDYTVKDEGCVIRSPFGSIDARIDIQLSEIKQALLEIARGSDTNEPT